MTDNQNIYTINNDELDTSTVIVPKDVPSSSDNDSYYTSSKEKTEVVIKVFNGLNENVDATPAFTSGDDQDFTEYDTASSSETATVSSGGSVPGSVETFRVEPSFTYHGVQIAPAADPTSGELKVIIEHKTYSA